MVVSARWAALAVIAAICTAVFVWAGNGRTDTQTEFSVPDKRPIRLPDEVVLISHAGSGLANGRYSNSLEALERGYADGLRVFEVDVGITPDGYPVLLHGWGDDLNYWFDLPLWDRISRFFGPDDRSLTKSTFMSLAMRGGLTQLDRDGLAAWMSARPDAIVELNVKRDALGVLAAFARTETQLLPRIVAEVYRIEDYGTVRDLGYDKVVWVADGVSEDAVLAQAERIGLHAIAVRKDSPTISLASRLNAAGVPLWVYTVNSAEFASRLADAGVSGDYTDNLYPAAD